MGFFDKIFGGLRKTRNTVQLDGLFAGFTKADDDFYEELEECLILADVGMQVTAKVVSDLRKKVKSERLKTNVEVKNALTGILTGVLNAGDLSMHLSSKPAVILFFFMFVSPISSGCRAQLPSNRCYTQRTDPLPLSAQHLPLPANRLLPSGRHSEKWFPDCV